jgi:serine/threonine-protein kinase RsbW
MPDIPINRTLKVASRTSASGEIWKILFAQLQASGFGQEEIFAIHLAFEEAFVNAAKHGNQLDVQKLVTIDYSISPDKVEISITDQGMGFDPAKVPDPRCGENIYKTSGRGLLLIRSYMDLAEYNEPGNSLHMIKYKKGCC